MNNILKLTVLALTATGIATTTLPVHAETTNTDTNNVSENQETRITPEMVADAKIAVDNAKNAVTEQEQAIAEAEQTNVSQIDTLNDALNELKARYASALEYYENLVVQLNAQTAVDNVKDNTDNSGDTDTTDNTGDTDNTDTTDNANKTGNKKDDYHEGVVDLSWLTNLKNPEDSPEANKSKVNKSVASSPKEQKTTKRVDRATLPQTGDRHTIITQIIGASLLLGSGYTFTRRKNRRKSIL